MIAYVFDQMKAPVIVSNLWFADDTTLDDSPSAVHPIFGGVVL